MTLELSAVGTMAWTQGPRASSSGATRTEAAPALYRDRCHLPPFLCSLRGRRLGQLPLAVNNSGSCTVNSLPQRITSGHCISKGLPSDPPRPPRGLSQQHEQAGARQARPCCHTGASAAALGPWAWEMPPPSPSYGDRVQGTVRASSRAVPFPPLTPCKKPFHTSLTLTLLHATQTAQAYFCPFLN